jgi:branched-chain amino acid transport system ATP-binding protein
MMLEINKIDVFYGLSHAIFGVSLKVKEGESVCLLGRNGMGKSTILKSIIGIVTPSSGNIKFEGEDITRTPTHLRVRRGIGYVPEDRKIFPNLTTRENLEMGKRGRDGKSYWTIEKAYELFPILKNRANQMAGTLSGGEQRMLTIGRTLMGNPRLVLIDEPFEGLAPLTAKEIRTQIRNLKKTGVTMILAEGKPDFVMSLSDRCYILEKGQIAYEGSVEGLKKETRLKKRYLGI